MTRADAKRLRDRGKSLNSTWFTVPLGHGPNGYFVQVGHGPTRFTSDAELDAWLAEYDRRNPPGARYWRLTVDTIVPPSIRPAMHTSDALTWQQTPVTRWLSLVSSDYFRIASEVERARPLTKYGLLYGRQERRVEADDGGHARIMADLAVRGYEAVMDGVREREATIIDAITAVDAFLAAFPHERYQAVHGMDRALHGGPEHAAKLLELFVAGGL